MSCDVTSPTRRRIECLPEIGVAANQPVRPVSSFGGDVPARPQGVHQDHEPSMSLAAVLPPLTSDEMFAAFIDLRIVGIAAKLSGDQGTCRCQ